MTLQDADANDAGFGARIRSAVFWRSGSQILSQMMSWVVTLAVIRMLDPADYGLFAMTQVILNFATFLNGYGLVSALVQSDTVETHRLRQAFTIMLLLNGALALLQLAIAPLAADYYDQPMVADLLRVQALLYLSTPFISVPEAIMGRALDFKRPALVNLIGGGSAGRRSVGMGRVDIGVRTDRRLLGQGGGLCHRHRVQADPQFRFSRHQGDGGLWRVVAGRAAVLDRAEPGRHLHRWPHAEAA
jgi:hypothetical protein